MSALPTRPRKASAGRRRRHCKQLPYRIGRLVPGAQTVLLTPVWTDRHGPAERVFVAVARDDNGARLPIPRGGTRRLAALLQAAYPQADWNGTQTWHADTNELTRWQPNPDYTASITTGLTETFAAYDTRMGGNHA